MKWQGLAQISPQSGILSKYWYWRKVQSEMASWQRWPLRRTWSDDIQLFNFVHLCVYSLTHLFIF